MKPKETIVHLQHPPIADAAPEYNELTATSTLCWNRRQGCLKSTEPAQVTCKKCLKILSSVPPPNTGDRKRISSRVR